MGCFGTKLQRQLTIKSIFNCRKGDPQISSRKGVWKCDEFLGRIPSDEITIRHILDSITAN